MVDKLLITAVVESFQPSSRRELWKGVTTNYLLAVKNSRAGESQSLYQVAGPRGKYAGFRIPLHIRTSNFRLTSNFLTPVIMVGERIGVAPFRAFVQERAAHAEKGDDIGMLLLFYRCRSHADDFMYSTTVCCWQRRLLCATASE